jgi:hypothetical protein
MHTTGIRTLIMHFEVFVGKWEWAKTAAKGEGKLASWPFLQASKPFHPQLPASANASAVPSKSWRTLKRADELYNSLISNYNMAAIASLSPTDLAEEPVNLIRRAFPPEENLE